MKSLYEKLGPLGPLGAFFLLASLVFALSRLGISTFFQTELTSVDALWRIYPIGLRMDAILICSILIIPTLILFVFPAHAIDVMRKPVALYFALWLSAIILLEILTGPFLNEFNVRPNQLFFQYFTHPKEVLSTVVKEFGLWLVLVSAVMFYVLRYSWRISLTLLDNLGGWRPLSRWVLLIPVLALLFFGIRSGFNKATPNPGLAAFSNNPIANQLALNSSYSLAYAVYANSRTKIRSEKLYGDMPDDEVFSHVKRVAGIETTVPDSDMPTLHTQTPITASDKPHNVVIIVMESMGAEYVESLGGLPLTPHLEKLAEEGTFFTNLYSTGIRTYRGLESLLSGFPPTTHYSTILKLSKSQRNFFTFGGMLSKHGYHSSFVYGGESHFDNMRGFVLGNGFDEVIDGADFDLDSQSSSWGVTDEYVFNYANEFFKKQDKPFASVILTLSNHTPFDFPDDTIELYETPKATPHNAAKYADYAIGKFFEKARKEDYFDNTLFLLVADHPMKIRAKELVPVKDYHIPAILIGPGVPKQRYDKLASQIDLLPTIAGLLGIEVQHPMIGRNLFTLDAKQPGRAMMQYDNNNAYQVEDKVVINTPEQPARQFNVLDDGRLEETETNGKLVKDALAHALFPSKAYAQKLYRLE